MYSKVDLTARTGDTHCTDHLDTADGIKTEVDAEISLFTDGWRKVDWADIKDGEKKGDGAGNTAYLNDTVDADSTKDRMSHVNNRNIENANKTSTENIIHMTLIVPIGRSIRTALVTRTMKIAMLLMTHWQQIVRE